MKQARTNYKDVRQVKANGLEVWIFFYPNFIAPKLLNWQIFLGQYDHWVSNWPSNKVNTKVDHEAQHWDWIRKSDFDSIRS